MSCFFFIFVLQSIPASRSRIAICCEFRSSSNYSQSIPKLISLSMHCSNLDSPQPYAWGNAVSLDLVELPANLLCQPLSLMIWWFVPFNPFPFFERLLSCTQLLSKNLRAIKSIQSLPFNVSCSPVGVGLSTEVAAFIIAIFDTAAPAVLSVSWYSQRPLPSQRKG